MTLSYINKVWLKNSILWSIIRRVPPISLLKANKVLNDSKE